MKRSKLGWRADLRWGGGSRSCLCSSLDNRLSDFPSCGKSPVHLPTVRSHIHTLILTSYWLVNHDRHLFCSELDQQSHRVNVNRSITSFLFTMWLQWHSDHVEVIGPSRDDVNVLLHGQFSGALSLFFVSTVGWAWMKTWLSRVFSTCSSPPRLLWC